MTRRVRHFSGLRRFSICIIECADRVCLMVDHTKFSRSAFTRTCPLTGIDLLITDQKVDEDWRNLLKEYDIQLVECIK